MSDALHGRATEQPLSQVADGVTAEGDPATWPGRILLVEDSDVVRAMVRQHLENEGYAVTVAENGEAALRAARAERPDVVLMNIEMPVLDGRQTLKQMKLDHELEDIPVIFLTGRTSREEMLAGLRMGAHDYLRKPFDPAELIARVSAALRVARLQQQLGKRNAELDSLSRTDVLTGLHNRRDGEEWLKVESARALRYRRPLSLVMIDIDFFKKINDRYGHARGDTVLREMSRRLAAVLRQGDIAARWGGEEFLVLLPDTDVDGAQRLGERVLQVMRSQPVVFDSTTNCSITVSLGVASGSGAEPDALLKRADDALYAAKGAGRDRLVLAVP